MQRAKRMPSHALLVMFAVMAALLCPAGALASEAGDGVVIESPEAELQASSKYNLTYMGTGLKNKTREVGYNLAFGADVYVGIHNSSGGANTNPKSVTSSDSSVLAVGETKSITGANGDAGTLYRLVTKAAGDATLTFVMEDGEQLTYSITVVASDHVLDVIDYWGAWNDSRLFETYPQVGDTTLEVRPSKVDSSKNVAVWSCPALTAYPDSVTMEVLKGDSSLVTLSPLKSYAYYAEVSFGAVDELTTVVAQFEATYTHPLTGEKVTKSFDYTFNIAPRLYYPDSDVDEGDWLHHYARGGSMRQANTQLSIFTMAQGDSGWMNAALWGENHQGVVVPATVSTSDSSVLSIDADGYLHANSVGSAELTFSYKGLTDTVSFNVMPSGHTLEASDIWLESDDAYDVITHVDTATGNETVGLTDGWGYLRVGLCSNAGNLVSATWASSNPDVMSVSEVGPYHDCVLLNFDTDENTTVTLSCEATYSDTTTGATVKKTLTKTFLVRVSEATSAKVKRLWGATALDTMAAVSQEGFADGSCGSVVLATMGGYWDALSATALAGRLGCPVLLTSPSSLSAQAASEIKRLGAGTVYVAGGEAAVSAAVESQVRELGAATVRLAGDNAQLTALEVYREGLSHGGGWGETAIVATSETFHDALSGAPYAYAEAAPVFLTNGNGTALDARVLSAIESGGFSRVLVLGGEAAVGPAVAESLSGLGLEVTRLWGDTAVDTSAEVAEFCLSEGMSAANAGVATGTDYYDALTGASLCGSLDSPLVLATDSRRSAVASVLGANASSVELAYVFGGEAAVSAGTYAAVEAALGLG